MTKLLVIQGPNLNALGTRETSLYGTLSLAELHQQLKQRAKPYLLEAFQSNAEHEIVDTIQEAPKIGVHSIIINPAAFTHTSIAIRDALLAVKIPFYEVHLTNIYARETFRHHSYLSDIAEGVVSGLGVYGYYAAIEAILARQKIFAPEEEHHGYS